MQAKQLWHWRGLDESGQRCEGARWAADRLAVADALQAEQIFILALRRSAVRTAAWRGTHRCEVVHQLATLLKAGLTLPDALLMLSRQHPVRQWQALLQSLAEDLAQGTALSAAMRRWPDAFPPIYIAMIHTGELTGALDECCFQLAAQQKTQLTLTGKVKKALRYPLIVLSLAVAVTLAMILLVLPEFAAIYQTFNTPLPALTRGVMALSGLITRAGPWMLAATLLLAASGFVLRNHPPWLRYRQRLLLGIPVVGGLVRGQKLSQIFTVLALTQRAGIAFLQGLESVEATLTCPHWREAIHHIHQEIAQGTPIWTALKNSGQFSALCIQLVQTGEVSGALDTMLDNLARHHSELTQQQADSLATLLEPLMLVVTGVIIGTLIVAMYLPIFHLGDAMSGMG